MLALIIDDQYEGKAKTVARILARMEGVEPIHVANSRDGLRIMKERDVELLILDIQIPAVFGSDVDNLGGQQLLEYIELNADIIKPGRVIGLTAHKDSFDQCASFFGARGWPLKLDPSEDELEILLRTQLGRKSEGFPKFDVAIITALEHTELQAVLKLPYKWEQVHFKNDITSYHVGLVKTAHAGEKKVIACSAPRMGMSATAALATKICLRFRPQFLVMTGVAAAVTGEAEIGDILVADPSWDWGSGKLTVRKGKPVFLSDPVQVPLNPGLAAKIRTLAVSRQYLDEIYAGYRGKRPPHDLNVRVGPVASGAVVLEDPATVALIRSQSRKTIGIEMEAYGVMSAAFYAGPNAPTALVLKSVCDFADPSKNSEWQPYAAYTSASYLDRLLTNHMY